MAIESFGKLGGIFGLKAVKLLEKLWKCSFNFVFQVDIEMSFVNKEGIQSLIEQLLHDSLPDGILSSTDPFTRMGYTQAMQQVRPHKPTDPD